MSKFIAATALIVVIAVIAYFAATGGFVNKNQVSGIVQQVTDYKQPTGDVITLTTLPPPEQPLTQDQIMDQQRIQTGINASSIQNSTITGSAGQTYGFTDQYKIPYGKDYYKIATPVVISGKLLMVIPNSCTVDQSGNLSDCEYIDPPKFKYNFYVTCEFREFCTLSDISRWAMTDNTGFFIEKIETNGGSYTKGLYKASIFANSEVKDANGKPYEIKVDYYFTMVD